MSLSLTASATLISYQKLNCLSTKTFNFLSTFSIATWQNQNHPTATLTVYQESNLLSTTFLKFIFKPHLSGSSPQGQDIIYQHLSKKSTINPDLSRFSLFLNVIILHIYKRSGFPSWPTKSKCFQPVFILHFPIRTCTKLISQLKK